MKRLFIICFALTFAASLRADTVVFHTGEELEGKILEKDEFTIKLEVETGTVLVPMDKVRRIDADTPEKIAEREKRKAEADDLAAKMKDEGKVLYKGKWVTEEAKKSAEDKVAADKQKKKEAADAAKKKAEEAAAKAKEEAAKLAAAAAKDPNQNSRENRFSRRHNRDDLTNSGVNSYNNGNGSSYNGSSQYNNSINGNSYRGQ